MAKPINVKWLGVVRMVGLGFFRATTLAYPLGNTPIPYGITNSLPGFIFFRILSPSYSLIFQRFCPTDWIKGPFFLVFLSLVPLFLIAYFFVFLNACLTFTKMTISHMRVSVEF